MHASIISVLGLLAASVAAQSYTQVINNLCSNSVFLTYTDGSQNVSSTRELTSGASFTQDYSGGGNSFGITATSDYWGDDKMILGTSVGDDGNLYWSISETGNEAPQSFSLVPNPTADSGICMEVDGYDGGLTHVCPASGQVLTLNLCRVGEKVKLWDER